MGELGKIGIMKWDGSSGPTRIDFIIAKKDSTSCWLCGGRSLRGSPFRRGSGWRWYCDRHWVESVLNRCRGGCRPWWLCSSPFGRRWFRWTSGSLCGASLIVCFVNYYAVLNCQQISLQSCIQTQNKYVLFDHVFSHFYVHCLLGKGFQKIRMFLSFGL
jgi:hypothetical protein